MLCSYCGATSSPALDRCIVCQTPFPVSNTDQTRLSGLSDGGPDATRLSSAAPPAATPPISPNAVSATGVPLLQSGQTFASRYTIIRLLGAGGMAAVYQAWDETLATAVALKLIRADPTMDRADLRQLEERFKRELKLARQVTHPNVVRIHDLGEVGGTLYLTMAYVQGSDLAAVLQREGRLPVPRVLSLARQVAGGLAAAHRAGVVHRDLKPANIMVDADGQALLTDFGIARSKTGEQTLLTEAGGLRTMTGSSLHTMPGAIMGTLEYMAPEQVRGEAADERTDVYAIGLILYELLSGRRPYGKPSADLTEFVARIQQGPPPLETAAPDLPPDVYRIVSKCLAPDPAGRYPSADDLLADLDSLDAEGKPLPVARRIPRWKLAGMAAGLGAVLVTATWWAASQMAPRVPPQQRPAVPILIVDFENRANDRAFDGVLEQALSIGMEGAPFITSYPRADATRLVQQLGLGTGLDVSAGRLIANREGIPVILAGSIDADRSGYRIAVRAVQTDKPEQPLASADVRARDKAAVLGAVGELAVRMREALGDTPPTAQQQQEETFTAASLDAVREYTVAQDLSANQRDTEAVERYRAALQHDPGFGRAYAGLAMSLHYLGQREEAAQLWDKALGLVDRMTPRERWRTAGLYYAGPARNYRLAVDEYKKLVTDYPADSAGHNNLAVAYFNMLDFAMAQRHGKTAIDIYPRSFKYRANYSLYAMYAGDFVTAAKTAQQLIEEDPAFDTAYLPLAMEALASGDTARARSVYDRAAKAGGAGASLAAIGVADLALYQGRAADAIAALQPGIELDLQAKNSFGAVAKLVALSEAQAAAARSGASQAALKQASTLAQDDNVLVTAARLAITGGRLEEARAIARELAAQLPPRSRAYGKVIEAELLMAGKQLPLAIDALNRAKELANLWLVHYTLGHAYFQLGDYQAAISEFEECVRRRGEATSLFLDDLPTFRYYAPVPYWLGRAREMRKLDPRTQYQEYVAIRGEADGDELVADARRRLAALKRP